MMHRCPKCRGYLAEGQECPICCVEGYCLRVRYVEGRCKRHADEHRYSKMRELEQVCREGTRVRCLGNHEWLTGVALSPVRIRWKPIPSRDRWPSVIVKLDGHIDPVEWPAMDVELAPKSEEVAA